MQTFKTLVRGEGLHEFLTCQLHIFNMENDLIFGFFEQKNSLKGPEIEKLYSTMMKDMDKAMSELKSLLDKQKKDDEQVLLDLVLQYSTLWSSSCLCKNRIKL